MVYPYNLTVDQRTVIARAAPLALAALRDSECKLRAAIVALEAAGVQVAHRESSTPSDAPEHDCPWRRHQERMDQERAAARRDRDANQDAHEGPFGPSNRYGLWDKG